MNQHEFDDIRNPRRQKPLPNTDSNSERENSDSARNQIPTTSSSSGDTDPAAPPIEPEIRSHDDGFAHANPLPQQITPISAEELAALDMQRFQQEWQQLANDELLALSRESWENRLFGTFPKTILFLLIAVFAIFIINQFQSILVQLFQSPPLWQWLGGSLLALFSGMIVYSIARLIGFYYRLKKNSPISWKMLQELEERKQIRSQIVHEQWKSAWERIRDYLQNYPCETTSPNKNSSPLVAFALPRDKFEQLTNKREELLDPNRFRGEPIAIRNFVEDFQGLLDQIAEQRINYWAKRCALSTAISPRSLIDSLATLYCGFSLMGDLCKIYQLRANRIGTIQLLSKVFFYSYLSGQVNELESLTSSQINEILPGHSSWALLSSGIVGKIGARVGEGIFNYYLIRRLGFSACQLLRMVQKKD